MGGALLTPASQAILQASFVPEDRARAVGAWSGLSGLAAAVGPLAGGWLIDALSWRWIYFTNVPVALVALGIAARHVPESRDVDAVEGFDVAGAVLVASGLASLTSTRRRGWVTTDRPGQVAGLRSHPDYARSVPTPDHFIPLLYLAGLASAAGRPAEVLVDGYAFGSVSMTACGLDAKASVRGKEPRTGQALPHAEAPPGEDTNL